MNKRHLLLAAALLAAPALAHNGVIHEAPHGGIMQPVKNADLEIVLAPKGGVRIYLNDAKGRPLPASAASELSVEIDRPGAKTEYVTMTRDPSGTLWTGNSKPVTDPKSIVRIGTVVQGASGLIEVPRAKFPVYETAAAKGGKARHAH
jgi:hypothetical protein